VNRPSQFALLLVEDNPGDARLLRELIRDSSADSMGLDFRVTVVGTLAAAINQLQERDLDLVLLDLGLPDSSGLEGLRRLIALTPAPPPIVVFSGLGDQAVALEALQIGAQDFLRKGETSGTAVVRTLLAAYERAQSQRATRRHALQQGALAELGRLGLQVASQESMIASAVENANRALGAELAQIYLREGNQLAVARSAAQSRTPFNLPVTLGLERTHLMGRCMLDNATLAVADYAATPGLELPPALRDAGLRSGAAAPVRVGNRVVGALVVHARTPDRFQAVDLDFLSVLAGTLAGWIERRDTAEQLQLLASALDQLKESVVITDAQLDHPGPRIVFANPACTQMSGFAHEELLGRTPRIFQGPKTDRQILDRLRAQLQAGEPFAARAINYRKDRSEYFVEWTISPVRNASGDVTHFVSIQRDITEEQRQAELLAERSQLLDQATDAIVVHDLDHRIIYWNAGAERLYGWTKEEALGRNDGELLGQETAAGEEAATALLEQGSWQGDLRHATKLGKVLAIEGRRSLLRDKEGRPRAVLAIYTDITEKREVERQFLRVQRLESIGTLASGVAHDLNNVLSPILLAAEFLKRNPNPKDVQGMVEIVASSAERGAALVRQVLSFARGLEPKAAEIQAKHIIREVHQLVSQTFPKTIASEIAIEPDCLPILADPTQLHQVLMNLCVNARDAMPDGGQLRISAGNLVIDAHDARLRNLPSPGSYVRIRVSDTGSGIPEAFRDRIFDPFFTTKATGKGTGLGLATVAGIAKNHHGTIEFQTRLNHGTTFELLLPAVGTQSAPRPGTGAAELARGRNELILVIDDEENIRIALQRTLQQFGYRVETAANGASAVVIFAARKDEIALVITDMAMPIMDGPMSIRAILQMKPDARFIVISGVASRANFGLLQNLAIRHMLPKPFTAEALLGAVRAALDAPPPAAPGTIPTQ